MAAVIPLSGPGDHAGPGDGETNMRSMPLRLAMALLLAGGLLSACQSTGSGATGTRTAGEQSRSQDVPTGPSGY